MLLKKHDPPLHTSSLMNRVSPFLGNHSINPSIYPYWAFMECNNTLRRLGVVLIR